MEALEQVFVKYEDTFRFERSHRKKLNVIFEKLISKLEKHKKRKQLKKKNLKKNFQNYYEFKIPDKFGCMINGKTNGKLVLKTNHQFMHGNFGNFGYWIPPEVMKLN